MKTIVAIVVVAMAALGSAMELDMAKIVKTTQCVACSKDPVVKEAYRECFVTKPEKMQQVKMDCKARLVPGVTSQEEMCEKMCQNEGGLIEKVTECIKTHDMMKTLTPEDMKKIQDAEQCMNELWAKYCH